MYLVPFTCLLALILSSATSAPQFDILDILEDEEAAEIAVPRSPKILGPQTEFLIFPIGYKMENLTCEVTGIPMPKVIWVKDGVGVHQLEPALDEDFNAETGLATLLFPEDKDATEYNVELWAGNYTCVAANFLGRASKFQIITFASETTSTESVEDSVFNSTTLLPTTTFTTETPPTP